MSRTERTELCDVALRVGKDQPTLSGDWTVKDLVVHLLLRESSPAAVGIVVPALAGLTDLESRRYGRRDFTVLVDRLRQGPPLWSPFAIPAVDALANTVEYFVHHEDIRRAQPSWSPRTLGERQEQLLWRAIRIAGRGPTRSLGVGLTLERSDTGERLVLKAGEPMAVVRGQPSELTLFVYGRRPQARVELHGADEAVRALRSADLGI
jgi:uncharacterized protein (TIGR03085 family)